MKRYVLSVLVENHSGSSRVSGLFSHGDIILTVTLVLLRTDIPYDYSCQGLYYIVEQIKKQLNKLIDVIKLS